MRIVNTSIITKVVSELCIKANNVLPDDIINSINNAYNSETAINAKNALKTIKRNIEVSKELKIPLCQDTGMAIVFVEIGQDVFLEGDNINLAINKGVRKGYLEGLLRCSVVSDPLNRINTND
ncbi:MAG: fumarate hydratase, partial [Clostridia bacterium]